MQQIIKSATQSAPHAASSAVSVAPQKFIRLPEVQALTGRSRSSILADIEKGKFPPSISIGSRAVAWTLESIINWQNGCIESSNQSRG